MSELCLGTMTFGDDWGWGASPETCRELLTLYLDAGGNFIDTANYYTNGSSERILGELLQGIRQKVVLATKYSLMTDSTNINSGGNQRKNMMEAVDESLRRLKTDYLDTVLGAYLGPLHPGGGGASRTGRSGAGRQSALHRYI